MAATRDFIQRVEPEDIDETVSNVRITREHFEQALKEVSPSVDEQTREQYEQIEEQFDRHEPGRAEEGQTSRTFQ